MIFFSIITPTFNRANELKRCYESLSKQTFKQFEWIICDDGSCDSTKDLITSFENVSIRYYYQNNSGVNSARNLGQSHAKGEYSIYLDSDDELYDENSLSRIFEDIHVINSSEVGMITYDSSFHRLEVNNQNKIEVDSLNNWLCNMNMNERIIVVNTKLDNPWPSFNGYEGIKHYKMLESHSCFYIRRSERIYHQGASNQLSSLTSFINNVYDGYIAIDEIWNKYNAFIINECPCMADRLIVQKIYRSLFLKNRVFYLDSIITGFRYLRLKNRLLLIFLSVYIIFPLNLRKLIFFKLKH